MDNHDLGGRQQQDVTGFGDWGRTLRVRYPRQVPLGVWQKMIAEGIEHAHSLTLEFYGPNGGIFRNFPRGRQSMPLVFRLRKPGRTSFFLIARDQKLRTLSVRNGIIETSHEQISRSGQTQPEAAGEIVDHQSELPDAPVLAADNKPPMAESDQGALNAIPGPAERISGSNLDAISSELQSRLEGRIVDRFKKP